MNTANGEEGPVKRARLKRSSRDRVPVSVVLAAVVLGLVAIFVAAPGLVANFGPNSVDASRQLMPPSFQHWFGTDDLGRDIFSRVVVGARVTAGAAAFAVMIGFTVGAAIGAICGYFQGWIDAILMRMVEVLLAIPGLLLAMAVITALGSGSFRVAIAVGVAEIPVMARVMRSEVLRVRNQVYIDAAVSSGTKPAVILVRHVLPNSVGPITSMAVLNFGLAILAVASLSFLGFGQKPPNPDWGSMVASGASYLPDAWWMTAMPGLVIALTAVSVSLLSRTIDKR